MLKLEVKKGAGLEGRKLSELERLSSWILVAHSRAGKITIPRGDTIIAPNDRVIVFMLPPAVKKIERLFG